MFVLLLYLIENLHELSALVCEQCGQRLRFQYLGSSTTKHYLAKMLNNTRCTTGLVDSNRMCEYSFQEVKLVMIELL